MPKTKKYLSNKALKYFSNFWYRKSHISSGKMKLHDRGSCQWCQRLTTDRLVD